MAATDVYTVERRRRISAPPATVRAHVVDLRRWRDWSPWEDLDPELERTFTGPEAGVGAAYAWSGNRKAGEGRMEIVRVDDQGLTLDLNFVRPFRSRSTVRFDVEPVGDGTEVVWSLTGPRTFMTKVMGIFTSMDRMIGPDLEKGLERLQAVAEADTW